MSRRRMNIKGMSKLIKNEQKSSRWLSGRKRWVVRDSIQKEMNRKEIEDDWVEDQENGKKWKKKPANYSCLIVVFRAKIHIKQGTL